MNELAHKQGTNEGLRELALFAGAGGGILGGLLLGWRTVCAVEYEPHAAAILVQRQNDGILQPFPIWDDVRTFDGKPWRGCVDVVSGGFPCQDISCAGKGKGINGERSGLWSEMARIICEVQPRYVLVENSPILTIRGLGVVLGDLAKMGFDARWGVLGHHHTGGNQKRLRIWIVANLHGRDFRYVELRKSKNIKQRNKKKRCKGGVRFLLGVGEVAPSKWELCGQNTIPEPNLVRKCDGFTDVVDRIKRIGNSQIPSVVRLAWEQIMERWWAI